MFIIGEVRSFAFDGRSTAFTNAAKAGWVPCDGRSLSLRLYSELGDAIGTNWGSENPQTNFCVPNLFGSFLRGASNWENETNDPDVNKRTPPRAGLAVPGNSGLLVGSYQEDSFEMHRHDARMEIGAEPPHGDAEAQQAAGAHGRDGTRYTSQGLIDGSGGKETRPKNHYVLFMIYSGKQMSLNEAEELAKTCVGE